MYLSSPDNLITSQFSLLIGSTIRLKLREKSIKLIIDAYKLIYETITNPLNEYQNSTSIVPRTPDQVSKLLL
jgi:hypothetical protein